VSLKRDVDFCTTMDRIIAASATDSQLDLFCASDAGAQCFTVVLSGTETNGQGCNNGGSITGQIRTRVWCLTNGKAPDR
jgi:hypothetical protein